MTIATSSKSTYKAMKKIGIIQSNYIPWLGYFDIINSVDTFILFDDVQYTRRDYEIEIKSRHQMVLHGFRYQSPLKEIIIVL